MSSVPHMKCYYDDCILYRKYSTVHFKAAFGSAAQKEYRSEETCFFTTVYGPRMGSPTRAKVNLLDNFYVDLLKVSGNVICQI